MKKRIKALWKQALNSGQYKQTINSLKDKNGFCCLGVLCDLYSRENAIAWDKTSLQIDKFLGETDYLPEEVSKWAGLPNKSPAVDTPIGYRDLSYLNDSKTPFKQIAEYIDQAF